MVKHALMDLYWNYCSHPTECQELREVTSTLKAGLDDAQKVLLLRLQDLSHQHQDDAAFNAFEIGFKLAASLAIELSLSPRLFCDEDHLALESDPKV